MQARSRGRPAHKIELTRLERHTLEERARGRQDAAAAVRATIVLHCANGRGTSEVAAEVGVSPSMVSKWRKRFAELRLDGLEDLPRPKADRRLSDAKVDELVRLTLERQSEGGWRTRDLAKVIGVSQSTVSRIWQAFDLNPNRPEELTPVTDGYFLQQIRDIAGLYLSPPDHAIVLCVERSVGTEPFERIDLGLGSPLGSSFRGEGEGTVRTDCWLTTLAGATRAPGERPSSRRAVDFAQFLGRAAKSVPGGLDAHLVMDNYAANAAPRTQRWLARQWPYNRHFVPSCISWTELAKRWLAVLRELADARAFSGVPRMHALDDAAAAYLAAAPDEPLPFVWTGSDAPVDCGCVHGDEPVRP